MDRLVDEGFSIFILVLLSDRIQQAYSMEIDDDREYFTSYENLDIHEIMLRDEPRNEAYRKAFAEYKSAFEVGKICFGFYFRIEVIYFFVVLGEDSP